VNDSTLSTGLIEVWALGYLARYASSAENLRRVLLRRARRKWHAEPDAVRAAMPLIEAVVERHCRLGVIDDASYAAQRAAALLRRGEPPARIRARLIAGGVAGALAAEAVAALAAEAGHADLVAACAFARRRRLGPYRTRSADRARELAAFARAGFGRRIAEAVLTCEDIAAVEALARNGLD
jgi:regulatory protein